MTSDPLPQIFMIETTLACNLRCPECLTGSGMIRRNGKFMDLNRFRIILDRIRPYVKYLYLYSWGEPLLNPDMISMIRCAAEITRTNISTNGLLLTEETAEDLITSGVADIIVSIDGVTQEVYGKYRVGGDVEKAKRSLRWLQAMNVKHGRRVSISPQFIVFRHNQDQMQAFYEFCRSLELTPSFKAPYIRTRRSGLAYSDYPQFIRPHFRDIASLRTAMAACPDPWQICTVQMDGSVVICCNDYRNETCFGNLFEQELPEIWNGGPCASFRHAILSGRAPDFCIKHCMSYFLESPEDIAAGFFETGRASFADQGEMFFMTGDIEAALEMFRKAVAVDQKADAAHNNLGVILWQQGHIAEAMTHFNAALERNPHFRPAVVNYAEALFYLGRKGEAMKVTGDYLRDHPGDRDVTDLQARITP